MFGVLPELPPLPPLNGAPAQHRAIVATLVYYDLFSFPLQADELARFAHDGGQNSRFSDDQVPAQSEWWTSRDNLWFLRGREHLVARRQELGRASRTKLEQSRRWARLLQLIPGVRFIGVTGSLAMQSAVPEDDIDFLIIAARHRLWLTRALVLGVLLALGIKRADDDRQEHPNLVCANIFLREDDLTISDQSLFIAHEICQMLPLLGPTTYARFLQANRWVRDYLPQWQPAPPVWEDRPTLRRVQRLLELPLTGVIGDRLDRELARRQLARIRAKHARGHNPNVRVSETQLRFHPRDLSDYIGQTFQAHWNRLNHEVAVPVLGGVAGEPGHLMK